jgi:tRNA 2-thiouridine synthesizing protein B
MSILHLLNKSPYETANLDTCVDYMRDGDALLLIEDAIYAAMKGGKFAARLSGRDVSVLGPDLAARGIGEDKLVDGVKVVGYGEFVDLSAEKDKVQSWL